jgi:hypothetical protein
MSDPRLRWAGIGLAALLAHGCVVAGPPEVGVGVEAAGPPDYGPDYYEPPAVYGGWGVGFDVAPYRGGRVYHPVAHDGGHPAPHAFRAAPAGRIPSIPSGPRGGSARGGGGGGRGGGGGGHR